MDINYINSNEERVRHLESVMKNVAKLTESENSKIECVLKRFKNHIDQDGYQCIANYIARARKKVEEAKPSLQHCGHQLEIMADKLHTLKNINSSDNKEKDVYRAVRNNTNSPYGTQGNAVLSPALPSIPITGLQNTNQTWNSIDDGVIFNTPETTGQKLNSNQGQADPDFRGTC